MREAGGGVNPEDNKLRPEDRAVHDWYRFVLCFPPHLIRKYTEQFALSSAATVLDPFCGTGTTLVECKKLGIASIGIERNPMACFASQVKVNWQSDPDALMSHAMEVGADAAAQLEAAGLAEDSSLPLFSRLRPADLKLRQLSADSHRLLLRDSISPIPLHKTLVLIESLKRHRDPRFNDHEILALAKAIVTEISNLRFGPEVGVGPPKTDAAVVSAWLNCVRMMAAIFGALRIFRTFTRPFTLRKPVSPEQ